MLFGGGSSCQQCGCGGASCSCRCSLGMLDAGGHQWWDDAYYPPADYCATNPCCSPTCLPCSLTLQFTLGNTWSGSGSGSLTAADKTDLQGFLSTTLVLDLQPLGTADYINLFPYAYLGSTWMGFVGLSLTGESLGGGDPCAELSLVADSARVPGWNPLGDGTEYLNVLLNAIALRYTGSTLFTTSTGKTVQGFFQGLELAASPPSDTVANRVLPFTGYDLCSSGSTSDLLLASHTATGATIQVASNLEMFFGGSTRAIKVRGSTIKLSW